MQSLKKALPHLCLILSGAYVVFLILDQINPQIAIINNSASKLLLLALCFVSIGVSVMQVLKERKRLVFGPETMETEHAGYPAACAAETTIASARQTMLSKVPEITVFFWIIKVLCTTVGETASDFLNVNLNFGLTGTSIAAGLLLAVLLILQFRAKKYVPGVYWSTVVLVSVFGTLVTDNMTDAMGVPLEYSTIGFSVALVITFAAWFAVEKTLSIHSIYTFRREVFYWLTVLFTFALGTAAGDLMAEALGLGYLVTGFIVVGVVIAVSIARKLKLNSDLAFWLVYIMTRPLGASLGDYLSQPPKFGGLGLGATVTSFIFVGAILLTVVFLSVTKKDQITKPSSAFAAEPSRKSFLAQAAAVVCVLALAGSVGYHMRQSALQAQLDDPAAAQASSSSADPQASPTPGSQVSLQNDPAPSAQQGSAVTAPPVSTAQADPSATAAPDAKYTKLGDLSDFLAIELDMLNMVNNGDLASAKTRADDLEYTWDNSEARLKPKNPAKWSQIDKTLDTLFRQVRAVKPSVDGCRSALTASISAIEQ